MNSLSKNNYETLKDKLLALLHIQDIDNNESLSFLHRNYNTRPSDLIAGCLITLLLLLLLLDGCNLLASLFCFLLPLTRCIQELAKQGKKAPSLFRAPSEQNSHFTDEEFSQLQSNGRTQTTQKYIVYFIVYVASEVLTPLLNWLLGAVAWLILRCLLAFALHRDHSLPTKLQQWFIRTFQSLRRRDPIEKQA